MLETLEYPQAMSIHHQSVRSSRPPDLQDQVVSVVGMGKSGVAAARLLQALGAKVTIVDEQDQESLQQPIAQLVRESIPFIVGKHWEQALHQVDLIVVSPGVSANHPVLVAAREQGIVVIGEIELACWFLDIPIISITGTNGKSTTVRLIGEILHASGKTPFVGGNLGIPLCEAVLTHHRAKQNSHLVGGPYDYAVVEASSFQLETIQDFRPWIAVLLNITPDHLDRHSSFEEYRLAKWRMFKNQTTDDFAVVNKDDPLIESRVCDLPSSVVEFSLFQRLRTGVWLEEEQVRASIYDKDEKVMGKGQIALRGDHNLSNVLAATAVGLLCGCTSESIRQVVGSFHGTEHVLEFVREHDGVKYYNDSKGTNVDATKQALASFHEPILLIIGGKDKGGDFGLLQDLIRDKVKTVIAIGEAAHRIVSCLNAVIPIVVADSLREATVRAKHEARAGDVVLFSPACSSFDMFKNYDHRGKEFKKLVGELGE